MKAVKIKSADFNNRRRTISVVYTSGKVVPVHYAQLGIKQNIESVWTDKETRGRSLGIRFEDGTEDFMPYDQPLALSKDSDYLLRIQMERLTAYIKKTISENRISKRYLAEQLNTSDNQIQRLLNPAILNKNLEQLYKIAMLLGLELNWQIKKAA
jgi:hypothetical protein